MMPEGLSELEQWKWKAKYWKKKALKRRKTIQQLGQGIEHYRTLLSKALIVTDHEPAQESGE